MQSVRTPLIIEPAILPTRYITGILPPVCSGGIWMVTMIEERLGPEGGKEVLIVDRFSLSGENLRQATWTALRAMKIHLALTS